MRGMSNTVLGLGIVIAGGLIAWWCVRQFIPVIPPDSLTYNSMHMIKRRILRYAHTHHELPKTLDELPVIPGYSDRLTDGWEERILYRTNDDSSITLTSYGKDGRPGGEGLDADMVGIFMLKTPDGRWQEELCDWVTDPFSKFRNREK